MLEETPSDNCNAVFERISLVQDMRLECDQRSMLQNLSTNAVLLEATSVVSVHFFYVLCVQMLILKS